MAAQDQPIVVRGAREHNLKSVDLSLPRNQLICFTGVSGSGKSSLAFDTLYAEGQRRYLESLSTYARQFVGQLPKPDVDFLSGLSPSISISQKSTGNNPRSTVGTITELHDFLRVLFARVGTGFCPTCNSEIASQTRDQMIERIQDMDSSSPYMFLAPIIRGQKGEHRELFDDLRRHGFNRARVDGQVCLLSHPPTLERQIKHSIELVVDRIAIDQTSRQRIAEAVDNAMKFGEGTMLLSRLKPDASARPPETPLGETSLGETSLKKASRKKKSANTTAEGENGDLANQSLDRSDPSQDIVFSSSYACAKCGISYPPPTPQLLSFNSPQGACKSCEGLGETFTFTEEMLVTDESKSVKNGAIQLVGKSSEMTKWFRRSLTYFANYIEHLKQLEHNSLLSTQWKKLPQEHRNWLLYGYQGLKVQAKGRALHGEAFSGIVPDLLAMYRATKNPLMTKQYEKYMETGQCSECQGTRLNAQARSIRLKTLSTAFQSSPWLAIGDCSRLSLDRCADFFSNLDLTKLQITIGGEAIKEVRARLKFLLDVGLSYLSLERTAPTLSGGESQRIRLASQIGAGLVGVLYVLDEPSIGLHPRDNAQLLASLERLRDLGNTLIVVEHDEDTMRAADTIVDFGPGPGVRGGELLTAGTLEEVAANPKSITGGFLNRTRQIHRPEKRRDGNGKKLIVRGAQHNNLKNIDVEIPLGCFVAVTGVSGSGKSSLISDVLSPALRNALQRAEDTPGQHKSIEGLEHLDKIIDIDQSPIGRTPRSNPATYVKVFDEIRDLFAELPESKRRGFSPGTFSFNTEQGRCSACDGHGANRLDMEFLADMWVPCPVCEGKRYGRPTLQVEFKGKSIADCLDLDVQQALEHFGAFPKIYEKLQTLHDVGLDYLKLGQPSPTLSGGEAQRIKLSKELSRRATGRTLYVLDEPTTGLHFYDIDLLLKVLQSLVDRGNTVIVIEHNLDLIQAADWVIDLGPEGGAGGGKVLCEGTPEFIAKQKKSHTGVALKKYFESHGKADAKSTSKSKTDAKKTSKRLGQSLALQDVQVIGAQQHNLKNIDLTVARNQMTVFCGQSGSGKTSMAMDTIYAEGQRRFVESLSPYVRQFVGQMPKPIVERVEGLSPSVAIEQRNLSHTPRSTVGTVTEIYDYFRVLFARLGQMHCIRCNESVSTQTSDQIIDRLLELGTGEKGNASQRALLLAPIVPHANQTPEQLFTDLKQQGFVRVRINGRTHDIDAAPSLQKKSRTELQLVVDRIHLNGKDRSRLSDSVSTALTMGSGVIQLAIVDDDRAEVHWDVQTFSLQLACAPCGLSFQPLTPHSFSFNTAVGWCPSCNGLGTQTGTDPAASVDDHLSLEQGALLLWPDLANPLAMGMLRAFCRESGIPIHRPVSELPIGQRSILFHGLPDREISVYKADIPSNASGLQAKDPSVVMVFQYRGVFPALELASNSNMGLRMRLSRFLAEVPCTSCGGARVRPEAAHSRFRSLTIADIGRMPIGELLATTKTWTFERREKKIAGELHREITQRLQFLEDVGLEYLTLDRAANTLSGGEAQRIRLASQLGSGLCGVLYVLDEPTIGLHPRDNQRLIGAMHRLRDLGNTLLVVEHDRDVIASSDQLCDFGPGSGPLGGTVVAQGTPKQIVKQKASVTGPFIDGSKGIELPSRRRIEIPAVEPSSCGDWTSLVDVAKGWLTIQGARANTLRNISVSIPLGCFTAVTGPSGSGKSSLINSILYPALARALHRADLQPGPHDRIDGVNNVNKVLRVDQSPLGNSPSSNPATYTGVFEHVRQLFAKLPDAKLRGLHAGHFSFNIAGGRCEKCEGNGQIRIQMHFLPDVWIECDACRGSRYSEEVLAVKYRGKSISDFLTMSIGEARDLTSELPKIHGMLKTLCEVGLDYLALGQSAPTLSGGEAQRVKLAAELCRPATGNTLYLLDEPTTGLHFEDIRKLMMVLNALVASGNTVVVIEHNLDVIKCADWIIDMGPEAGKDGGQVVFAGTPESLVRYASEAIYKPPTKKRSTKKRSDNMQVAEQGAGSPKLRSYTGEALKSVLPLS
ncbi:MAG: excinuclease ABC subunit UvrA [Planctomycetota bacterium]|nr:excinuclease ABC subunit UvrA [Planctomycetota bacterium]